MADYIFPTTGVTKWFVTGELIYGIPPFTELNIDWTAGNGFCKWGKKCKGLILGVKVNANRDGFTANFAIIHAHREKRSISLKGTMKVTVKNKAGRIAMKISGMPDWRDNTTFECNKQKDVVAANIGGKNFDVVLENGAAGKLVAQAQFGNLTVRDRDRHTEQVYPLIAAGAGLAIGVTVYASTSFENVRLKSRCRDWGGAAVSIFSAGTSVIVGGGEVQIEVTLPDKQTFKAKWSGYSLGADISVNWGSQVVGKLGPKTIDRPY